MKPGDLVRPKSNKHSRWYGHPDSGNLVGLIVAEHKGFWKPEHNHYDVVWIGDIFEPSAAGIALEVVGGNKT